MALPVLDETVFDRFVSDNDTVVIGFRLLAGIAALDMERVRAQLEQERSARESLAVHRVCPATRRGKLE